jgi:hypothetical protein
MKIWQCDYSNGVANKNGKNGEQKWTTVAKCDKQKVAK